MIPESTNSPSMTDQHGARAVVTLPESLPGHWTTPAGREMAMATLDDPHMARSRERISDFHLANEVFLSPGIANLTDAKERIRWLSAQLAVCQTTTASLEAENVRLREVVASEKILAEMLKEAFHEADPSASHHFDWADFGSLHVSDKGLAVVRSLSRRLGLAHQETTDE